MDVHSSPLVVQITIEPDITSYWEPELVNISSETQPEYSSVGIVKEQPIYADLKNMSTNFETFYIKQELNTQFQETDACLVADFAATATPTETVSVSDGHQAYDINDESMGNALEGMFMFDTLLAPNELQCPICNEMFNMPRMVALHLNKMHLHCPQTCAVCLQVLDSKYDLDEHVKAHRDEKSQLFLCNICSKSYTKYGQLKEHKLKHSGTLRLCPVCNKILASIITLNKHLKLHDKMKDHRCTICMTSYLTFTEFQRHMKKEHSILGKTKPKILISMENHSKELLPCNVNKLITNNTNSETQHTPKIQPKPPSIRSEAIPVSPHHKSVVNDKSRRSKILKEVPQYRLNQNSSQNCSLREVPKTAKSSSVRRRSASDVKLHAFTNDLVAKFHLNQCFIPLRRVNGTSTLHDMATSKSEKLFQGRRNLVRLVKKHCTALPSSSTSKSQTQKNVKKHNDMKDRKHSFFQKRKCSGTDSGTSDLALQFNLKPCFVRLQKM